MQLALAWKRFEGRCDDCGVTFCSQPLSANPYPNGFDCPLCLDRPKRRRPGRVHYRPV